MFRSDQVGFITQVKTARSKVGRGLSIFTMPPSVAEVLYYLTWRLIVEEKFLTQTVLRCVNFVASSTQHSGKTTRREPALLRAILGEMMSDAFPREMLSIADVTHIGPAMIR